MKGAGVRSVSFFYCLFNKTKHINEEENMAVNFNETELELVHTVGYWEVYFRALIIVHFWPQGVEHFVSYIRLYQMEGTIRVW